MERVKEGFIAFTKEQGKIVRAKKCPSCPIDCSGPDSKTGTAEVKSTISQNLSDAEIVATAPCIAAN